MKYTVENIIEILKAASDEKRYKYNQRNGVLMKQYGTPMGVIRDLAKKIKIDHELALELWNTEQYELTLLSIMLLSPKHLTEDNIIQMVERTNNLNILDEFIFRAAGYSNYAYDFMESWIGGLSPCERKSSNLSGYNMKRIKSVDSLYKQRCGWNFAIVLNKENKLEEHTINNLLTIIEDELIEADDIVQEAMNRCLCEIGFRNDDYTERCIGLGEKLGVYKDMKVTKGCTSPYAPDWIRAVLKNKK